nr:MAG TPA: hypothetical protein [Caudoviricetes sp.]
MKNSIHPRHLFVKNFLSFGNRGKELFPTAR